MSDLAYIPAEERILDRLDRRLRDSVFCVLLEFGRVSCRDENKARRRIDLA